MASVPFNRKERVPCRHYMQGKCNRGKSCPFAHVDRKEDTKNNAMAAVLKLVFEKQGDTLLQDNGRMLNLASLASCPDLEKVKNGVDFDSMAFCEALIGVVRGLPIDLQYISADDNDIKSLYHFLKALERADLHNGIRALSAMNNRINTFEFIKQLKPFENLIEIRLAGNPIAEKPEYRTAVRKGLPNLEGLDGEGVNRPPLNLPWPKPTEQSDEVVALLQQVEQRLFRVLESGGSIDSLSGLYGDEATFSLTCGSDATVKAPTLGSDLPRRNTILRDFVAMRMAQTDRDNDLKQTRTVRTARGRTDVCSALRSTLYPRSMECLHVLSSDSQMVALSAGVKAPMYVFTFHGKINWRHKEQPPDSLAVSRNFERTLVVLENPEGGGIYIANDAVTLRADDGPPLWFAQSEGRVKAMAEKYELPEEVMQAVTSVSTNDIELHAAAQDLLAITPEQFLECRAAVGSEDLTSAVLVARLAVRTSAPPGIAAQALITSAGDMDAAANIIAGAGTPA